MNFCNTNTFASGIPVDNVKEFFKQNTPNPFDPAIQALVLNNLFEDLEIDINDSEKQYYPIPLVPRNNFATDDDAYYFDHIFYSSRNCVPGILSLKYSICIHKTEQK